MIRSVLNRQLGACLAVLTACQFNALAFAHMPWLGTDDDGHVLMWFGESPSDRTYHLPKPIAAIQLHVVDSEQPIKTSAVDTDAIVGLRSVEKSSPVAEVFGSVTYGTYHGTKLTYHVEHLPHGEASTWPTAPRTDAVYQTVVTELPAGGVSVAVLANGKPLSEIDVKLFCEDGHEEANGKTDAAGMITFGADVVEPGLNALMVSVSDPDAKGELNGEPYSSATDILTATFFGHNDASKSEGAKSSKMTPRVDSKSDAKIVASGLPDLPEELTSFGAAIADGRLYVYGGHTGSAHSYSTEEQSNRLWSLNLESSDATWDELTGGPRLQGLALVAVDGKLIRIGGFTAVNAQGDEHDLRSQASVAMYDRENDRWTDLAPLPEKRSSLDAVAMGSSVFVFGGWKLEGESTQWHQTAWSLDTSSADPKWRQLATPNFQRRAISAAAHQGRLYVLGGMQSEGGPTTRVDVYDPVEDSWSEGPAMPGSGMAGFGSAAFATGGRLYVSTMDGFVHRLSRDKTQWETIAKSDPARFFHRMLPVSDTELLMIGGANMEVGKFTEIETVRLTK